MGLTASPRSRTWGLSPLDVALGFRTSGAVATFDHRTTESRTAGLEAPS
ncbi:MAG: hypothetical protein RL215_1795, partial [Planctomycetota bacterium]